MQPYGNRHFIQRTFLCGVLMFPLSVVGKDLGAADPCLGAMTLSEDRVSTCREDGSCDKAERVYLMCHLRESLVRRYVLLHAKEKLLGTATRPFRSIEHLTGCARTELKFDKERNPLAFEDRLRECLAAFQDSHLEYDSRAPAPPVYLGFTVSQIGDRFFVTRRFPKLLGFVTDSHGLPQLSENLVLGAELVSIDGVPPAKQRDRLAKFISGSSAAYVNSLATAALTERNFSYPSSSTAEIHLRTEKGDYRFRLPWWSHPHRRRDVAKVLKTRGILSSELIRWKFNSIRSRWEYADLDFEGYGPENTILPKVDAGRLTSYLRHKAGGDSSSAVAFRLGPVTYSGGRAFGYVQVLSFQGKQVVHSEDPEEVVDYIKPIAEFVSECRNKDLPLILDLRHNVGGNPDLPTELVGLFAHSDGRALARLAVSFRVNPHTQRMLLATGAFPEEKSRDLNFGTRGMLDHTLPEAYDLFEIAVRKKRVYTDWILGKKPSPPKDYLPYSGKLVVLSSPACVSACEIAVALFKKSGTAHLLGEPTNGTGAGYQDTDLSNSVTEDLNSYYRLRIPSFLFGVARPGGNGISLDFEKASDEVAMENKPVLPDTLYTPVLKDLIDGGGASGWLKAATDHIFATN